MKSIVIMAGGTGGHVFPGIALAQVFAAKGIVVNWLGTEGGMEKNWVEQAQIPFHQITIKGLRGNGLIGWLTAPFNVFRAWRQSRKILKDLRPDVVLGMGGFVCGPGGLAAKSLGIDLVLHEQNAIPGMTNKWLAPYAKLVITAFPQHILRGSQVKQLGNPVREGFEQLPTVKVGDTFKVLVVGGSRGALALNEMVPKALAMLPQQQRPQVLHQTGEKTLQQAMNFYQQAQVEAKVVPFIDDMVTAFADADLLICRSGALTVSELMAAARPAIMVPYPHAVDDHQTANAKALVEIGGGEVIQQVDLAPELLAAKLVHWMQPGVSEQASESIRAQAPKQITEKIVNAIESLYVCENR